MCTQLINNTDGDLAVFTRYGRTGTAGSCVLKTYRADQSSRALQLFADTFLEKTGTKWDARDTYQQLCALRSLAMSISFPTPPSVRQQAVVHFVSICSGDVGAHACPQPCLAVVKVLYCAAMTEKHLSCRDGKYKWVQVDHVVDQQMWQQQAKWQYWVDDGVDGKSTGVRF